MGEMRYSLDENKRVIFDEEADCGCLCTFPYNDDAMGKKLSKGRVANLALLGASVAIVNNNPEKLISNNPYDKNYYYLPDCLPKWIVDEIYSVLKIDTEIED